MVSQMSCGNAQTAKGTNVERTRERERERERERKKGQGEIAATACQCETGRSCDEYDKHARTTSLT
jgi:hypothetical protein